MTLPTQPMSARGPVREKWVPSLFGSIEGTPRTCEDGHGKDGCQPGLAAQTTPQSKVPKIIGIPKAAIELGTSKSQPGFAVQTTPQNKVPKIIGIPVAATEVGTVKMSGDYSSRTNGTFSARYTPRATPREIWVPSLLGSIGAAPRMCEDGNGKDGCQADLAVQTTPQNNVPKIIGIPEAASKAGTTEMCGGYSARKTGKFDAASAPYTPRRHRAGYRDRNPKYTGRGGKTNCRKNTEATMQPTGHVSVTDGLDKVLESSDQANANKSESGDTNKSKIEEKDECGNQPEKFETVVTQVDSRAATNNPRATKHAGDPWVTKHVVNALVDKDWPDLLQASSIPLQGANRLRRKNRLCEQPSNPQCGDHARNSSPESGKRRNRFMQPRRDPLAMVWICAECKAVFSTCENLQDHQMSECHWSPTLEETGQTFIRKSQLKAHQEQGLLNTPNPSDYTCMDVGKTDVRKACLGDALARCEHFDLTAEDFDLIVGA